MSEMHLPPPPRQKLTVKVWVHHFHGCDYHLQWNLSTPKQDGGTCTWVGLGLNTGHTGSGNHLERNKFVVVLIWQDRSRTTRNVTAFNSWSVHNGGNFRRLTALSYGAHVKQVLSTFGECRILFIWMHSNIFWASSCACQNFHIRFPFVCENICLENLHQEMVAIVSTEIFNGKVF